MSEKYENIRKSFNQIDPTSAGTTTRKTRLKNVRMFYNLVLLVGIIDRVQATVLVLSFGELGLKVGTRGVGGIGAPL